jgi:hypothetical protein
MPGASGAKLVSAAIVLVLAWALGGCGQDATVGADRTLELALSEYRLNPRSVRAHAGPLTILVHNYGRLTHNLAISANGQFAGSTGPIAPGQSAELMLTLAPRTYQIASTILSDEALGEYGTLSVAPSSPAGGSHAAANRYASPAPASRRSLNHAVARSSSNGGNHRRRRRGQSAPAL